MNEPASSSNTAAKRPRRPRLLLVAGVTLMLVFAMPWLLAKTPLRDLLLSAIVGSDDLSVTSRDASFGYFSPLALDGLRIDSIDQATSVQVEMIQADNSWLGLLVKRPDLGTFQFDRPSIDVLVDPTGEQQSDPVTPEDPSGASVQLPTMKIEIREAAVIVRTSASKDPPIDMDELSVTMNIENANGHSLLSVEPVTLFDHQRITPELCSHGLQLVAPVLDNQVDAEGEFSLSLSQFRIPLATSEKANIQIRGELQLHEMNAAIKNPLTRRVADVAFQMIGGSTPETIVIAEGVNVEFRVVDGRVHHQGLAMLIPRGESSIRIISSGSVGLDESLDLRVSIQLPRDALGESVLASKLTAAPIELAITGTLDDPQVGLPDRIDWVRAVENVLLADPDTPAKETLEENVSSVLGELLRSALEQRDDPSAEPPVAPRLRDWLRKRRSGGTPPPEPGDPEPTDI